MKYPCLLAIQVEVVYKKFSSPNRLNYNVLEIKTNPIAYKYWSDCMSKCNEKIGLVSWIQEENTGVIAVILKYNAPPGNQRNINYTINVNSEDSTYSIKGFIVPNGQTTELCIRKFKENKSSTIIAINGGGFSNTLKSTFILNNKNQVRNVSISYKLKEYKEITSVAVASGEHSDVTLSDFPKGMRDRVAAINIPCPTNPNITLPMPLSCGKTYIQTYVPLQLSADDDYTFENTPSLNNVKCISGECGWNANELGNGICPDGRKKFIVAVDNKTFKSVYLNVGSHSTTYQLNMIETRTKTVKDNIPYFNTDKDETIFVLNKNQINDISLQIDFLNYNRPVTFTFEELKKFASITESGENYIVKLPPFNKNNLRTSFQLE